ncbi:MAG: VWA domain-containing protein, partial [Bacteroidales bacterium]|nr:VWA domain-containing protein [Bacteroidales bacterium]
FTTAVLFLIILQGCYSLKKSKDYYGIQTQDLKKIVFILDISGSMEGQAETNLKGEVVSKATHYAAEKAGSVVSNEIGGEVGNMAGSLLKKKVEKSLTKLQKARKELIPAIKGLPEDALFDIIIFENTVKVWRTGMVEASKSNKRAAQTYLETLKSGGGTNIYDAMGKAFEMAGTNVSDSMKPINVETVFLLSDGAPSSGSVTSPDGIREAVKKWNSYHRITIHTIGLGKDCDENFMKGLATDNNGIYIDK